MTLINCSVPRTGNGCGDCASASPTASTCAAPPRPASCAASASTCPSMPAPAGGWCTPSRSVASTAPRRRWWLIKHALNDAEVAITAILEDDTSWRAIHDDTLDDLPGIVPNLDDLSDIGDPCLRW